MSDFLPAENVAAAETWTPPDVDAPRPKPQRFSTARQLEEIQRVAYEEGKAQGLEEGRRIAADVLRQKLAALDNIFSTLHAPLEKLDDDVMREITQLATTVAMQIVQHELSVNPGIIADCVRRAVDRVASGADRLRVYLHPEDAALLREMMTLDDIERSWRVIEDASMSRGGCRVETATSSVNATLEARIGNLLDAALGETLGQDA
ncbi:MAG TPA: FliH/SctL family protein [Gammaproteobacteria bacterium]|nr:FliH/SctL family protein [Gammaproteobacteria bacterium]